MYHLYVREKVEIGLRQLDAGLCTDHDEVFRKLEELEEDGA